MTWPPAKKRGRQSRYRDFKIKFFLEQKNYVANNATNELHRGSHIDHITSPTSIKK